MPTFAHQLKQAMSDSCVKAAELSERTGIGKSSLSQYLSGKNVPTPGRIEQIACALGCTKEKLMEREAVPAPVPIHLDRITTKMAAQCLHKSTPFVRIGLQRGILPFGSAVPGTGERYIYYINPSRLREYAGAEPFDQFFGTGEHAD